jgi:hypothetical protein
MAKPRVLPITSVRAIPGLLDATAKAIYHTHKPKFPIPEWINASDEVRDWVTAQAVQALKVVDQYLDDPQPNHRLIPQQPRRGVT